MIYTMKEIQRLSLNSNMSATERVSKINQLATSYLLTINQPPRDSAKELVCRFLRILLVYHAAFASSLPLAAEVEQDLNLLCEAFLEGATNNKLEQIKSVLQSGQLLLNQKLHRIQTIVGEL